MVTSAMVELTALCTIHAHHEHATSSWLVHLLRAILAYEQSAIRTEQRPGIGALREQVFLAQVAREQWCLCYGHVAVPQTTRYVQSGSLLALPALWHMPRPACVVPVCDEASE